MPEAKVYYSYGVFNETPTYGKEIKPDEMWLFDSPILILRNLEELQSWVLIENNRRDETRINAPYYLLVDKIAGGATNVIIRRKLVIELDWEDNK